MPAGVAGDRGGHALQVLEDGLHTPKTSAGENHFLFSLGGRQRSVGCRLGKGEFGFDGPGTDGADGGPCPESDDQRDGQASAKERAAHGNSPMTVFHSGIRQRRFVGCKVDFGGYPKNCARKKKGRAYWRSPPFSTGRAAGPCVRIETFRSGYSGLLISPQAIRGGAVLEAPEATAWMTMAVPPLLNTE